MSKEEELQRFEVELEKQIKKGNKGNIKYCRLNIERLEKEIAAQHGMHADQKRADPQPEVLSTPAASGR